jgi:glycosyltransferase involved in cell wall biosynthesis
LTGLVNADGGHLVSVVMNCYNSAKYLREAIDSVFAQTYQNWEIVFWDNQSTDQSAEIAKSYSDVRLRYFLAPEFTKLGQARNCAVTNAKGEWFGFLDCDDIWMPGKLASQMDIVMHESIELGLVYGHCLVINSDDECSSHWANRQNKYTKDTFLKTLPEGRIFEKLLKFNFIPMVTAIVSRSIYHEVGVLSDYFEMAEDYELFVKISASKKIRAVQNNVAFYRVHKHNNSIDNLDKGFNEILEIVGRYLPDVAANNGLNYQYTAYALMLMKDGYLYKGLKCFFKHGRLKYIFSIFLMKITRKI